MSDPGKAVFLSYASQDAEAAKRICEALRAAGVEVWFDQDELVGGDAWDAKIRKQIGSCALFVPVISANTQARAEGYFRLEWRLADKRTELMGKSKAFLLPVCIDDTRDSEADVPDSFMAVQWTRLKGGETTPAFCAQVQRLLSGGRNSRESGSLPTASQEFSPPPKASRRWLVPVIVGAVAVIGLALWLTRQADLPAPAAVTTPDPKSQTPSPNSLSAARQLAERARALSLDQYNSTASDFATAEGLILKAAEMDPNDAEIWAIASLFHTSIRTRGFDHAAARRELARSAAERAVKLAPDSINALYALGRTQRVSDRSAAETTFKRILALDPNHAEAMAQLAWICDLTDRFDEALPLYDRVLELDPQNAPLTRYVRYLLFFHYGRFAEAEAEIRQSVALQPSANSIAGQAMVALTWRGDAQAAARALAVAPTEIQSQTRMIWVGALVHLARRDPAEVLRTLARTESDYLQDNWFAGPKALFAGLAHRQAGRQEAARVAWESALAVVDARLKTTPDNGELRLARGQLLAWLGRTEEARREARALEEMGQEPLSTEWIGSSTLIHAALGDAATAVPQLERYLAWDRNKNTGWPLTPELLRIDARWDAIRDDPRFRKLVEELASPPVARDWPKHPELKQAMNLAEGLEAIPDDLTFAEEITQRVLGRSPTDIEAMTVMARVQSHFMRRGFDRSDERAALAKRYAERALQLAPDEPEAMYALAAYHFSRVTGETVRIEQLLRRAIELDPSNPRPGRMLADLYNATYRHTEAIAQAQDNIRRFPNDVLSHYDLARNYKDQGRYDEFDRELDATLALAPLPNAIVWKARLQFGLRNDFPGMKAWLDRVPARVRGTERAVFGYFLYAAFGGDPEAGLEALRNFPQKWFTDFEYAGPTALLNASLLELQGKKELALRQYEMANGEIQRMRQTDPARIGLSQVEFWTLLGLGRREEAKASHRRMVEGSRRPYVHDMVNGWWFTAIPASLLIGDRAVALTFLRESVEAWPSSRAAFRLRFQIDPRMAPFRDDPEIAALLAEPAAGK